MTYEEKYKNLIARIVDYHGYYRNLCPDENETKEWEIPQKEMRGIQRMGQLNAVECLTEYIEETLGDDLSLFPDFAKFSLKNREKKVLK